MRNVTSMIAGLFALGAALGAGGMYVAQRPGGEAGATERNVPLSTHSGGPVSGNGNGSSPKVNPVSASDEPERDMMAALRAMAVKYTQEERLAELQRRVAEKRARGGVIKYSGDSELLVELMSLILPEDIAPLMQQMEAEEKMPYRMKSAILTSWAQYDPAAMETWLRAHPKSRLKDDTWMHLAHALAWEGSPEAWDKMVAIGMAVAPGDEGALPDWCRNLIEMTARRDPEAMYHKAAALESRDRSWMVQEVLTQMSLTDLDRALELARLEPPGDFATLELVLIREQLDGDHPDFTKLIPYLDEVAGDQAQRLRNMVLRKWRATEPEAFAAWAAEHPGELHDLDTQLSHRLEGTEPQRSPSEEFAHLLAQAEPATPSHLKYAAASLAKARPEEAVQTLESLDPALREMVGPRMVLVLTRSDPALAQRALATLPPGRARSLASRKMLQHWKAYDRAGATAWIDAQPDLSEDERANFRQSLEEDSW